MAEPANGRRAVIGVGNPDRGDDGVGRFVARRLNGRLPLEIEIREESGEISALLDALEGADAAVLIDACASGAEAGSALRFDVAAAPLPAQSFAFSSHGVGLAEAIELARSLGALPRRCVVYAVEAVSFTPGAPLSAAVAAAIDGVAERARAEILGETTK